MRSYIGGKARNRKHRWQKDPQKNIGRGVNKTPVMVLVERGGQARSFRVANVTGRELRSAISEHVGRESRIITDGFASYRGLRYEFARHDIINHALDEYVRGDVHTNTAENFFSILKRGIDGVYHHVSPAHLPRYLAEFDFRYNHRTAVGYSDAERTRKALSQTGGKRLRYSETRAGTGERGKAAGA